MDGYIGNWVNVNPNLPPHKAGYENVLDFEKSRMLGAFKLSPVFADDVRSPMIDSPISIRSRVLNSQRVRSACEMLATSFDRPLKEISDLAVSSYDSMAASLDPVAIRGLFFVIAPFMHKMFSQIFVNSVSVCQQLKSIVNCGKALALLPTHRSYLDFVLLDYILYCLDMPLPAIAAAMDFSSMKFVGEWMRRCGAFFIKRGAASEGNLVVSEKKISTDSAEEGSLLVRPLLDSSNAKGDDWKQEASDYLHRVQLTEYMNQLVLKGAGEGHNQRFVEFFIEGKRSRTGKGNVPKRGMLGWIADVYLHGSIDDVYFCPVSICYDKFAEESLFVNELLGIPKPKESTLGLLRSIQTILSTNYGSVMVTFGQAMSLRDLAAANRINRQVHSLHPVWISFQTVAEARFLSKLALTIVDAQHQLTSIPIFGLVAVCLISVAVTSASLDFQIPFSELTDRASWLINLLKQHTSLSISHSLDNGIIAALKLHREIVSFSSAKDVCLSPSDMEPLSPLLRLNLYSNQAMLSLFPAATISLILSSAATGEEIHYRPLFEQFKLLSKILRYEFVSSASFAVDDALELSFNRTVATLTSLQVIQVQGREKVIVLTSESVRYLASLLVPFVYAYSLCLCFILLPDVSPSAVAVNSSYAIFLKHLSSKPTSANFTSAILKSVEQLSHSGHLPFLASWSMTSDLIGNFAGCISEEGLISRRSGSEKKLTRLNDLQQRLNAFLRGYWGICASICPETLASLVVYSGYLSDKTVVGGDMLLDQKQLIRRHFAAKL